MERLRQAERPALDPNYIEVVDWEVARILAQKSGAERVAMGFELLELAREVVSMGVRHQHPDWNTHQVSREVAQRFARDTE